jgi:hypothetical protein
MLFLETNFTCICENSPAVEYQKNKGKLLERLKFE